MTEIVDQKKRLVELEEILAETGSRSVRSGKQATTADSAVSDMLSNLVMSCSDIMQTVARVESNVKKLEVITMCSINEMPRSNKQTAASSRGVKITLLKITRQSGRNDVGDTATLTTAFVNKSSSAIAPSVAPAFVVSTTGFEEEVSRPALKSRGKRLSVASL